LIRFLVTITYGSLQCNISTANYVSAVRLNIQSVIIMTKQENKIQDMWTRVPLPVSHRILVLIGPHAPLSGNPVTYISQLTKTLRVFRWCWGSSSRLDAEAFGRGERISNNNTDALQEIYLSSNPENRSSKRGAGNSETRNIISQVQAVSTRSVKVKLSLCLTKHQAMKICRGSGAIAPRINLGTRWTASRPGHFIRGGNHDPGFSLVSVLIEILHLVYQCHSKYLTNFLSW